jgi:hypothetical protein
MLTARYHLKVWTIVHSCEGTPQHNIPRYLQLTTGIRIGFGGPPGEDLPSAKTTRLGVTDHDRAKFKDSTRGVGTYLPRRRKTI